MPETNPTGPAGRDGTPTEGPVPRWLTAALRGSSGRVAAEDDFAEVGDGDVRVVGGPAGDRARPRLVVVLAVDGVWCDVVLAGAETELATEVDAVLGPPLAGLGYSIAVHTRYRARLPVARLGRRVGALGPEVVADLELLGAVDDATVDVPVGVPLLPDVIDPRYPALVELSRELDALIRAGSPETAP